MDRQRLEREINILKNTFHNNIIKIYQVKENSKKFNPSKTKEIIN